MPPAPLPVYRLRTADQLLLEGHASNKSWAQLRASLYHLLGPPQATATSGGVSYAAWARQSHVSPHGDDRVQVCYYVYVVATAALFTWDVGLTIPDHPSSSVSYEQCVSWSRGELSTRVERRAN